jgi:dihydroxyacetone kinase-like predicted kinase
MTARVREWFPKQEVETQRGGQPYYDYIIAVE